MLVTVQPCWQVLVDMEVAVVLVLALAASLRMAVYVVEVVMVVAAVALVDEGLLAWQEDGGWGAQAVGELRSAFAQVQACCCCIIKGMQTSANDHFCIDETMTTSIANSWWTHKQQWLSQAVMIVILTSMKPSCSAMHLATGAQPD
jgi:hypothetical protein